MFFTRRIRGRLKTKYSDVNIVDRKKRPKLNGRFRPRYKNHNDGVLVSQRTRTKFAKYSKRTVIHTCEWLMTWPIFTTKKKLIKYSGLARVRGLNSWAETDLADSNRGVVRFGMRFFYGLVTKRQAQKLTSTTTKWLWPRGCMQEELVQSF